MGLYQHISNAWKTKSEGFKQNHQKRLMLWRNLDSLVKIESPTNLPTARRLGYKAKQGYLIVRSRVLRGGRKRPQFHSGRRSKHMRRKKILSMSYQVVAEGRVARKYVNCEVLNSYKVGKDAKHYWYEVILIDKNHPNIKNDKRISWITHKQHKGRVFRGLTSAGKKSRGMLGKGKGYEKIRPSLRANKRQGTN